MLSSAPALLELVDALDTGKFKQITMTIVVTRASVGSGGSGIAVKGTTTAVNDWTCYGYDGAPTVLLPEVAAPVFFADSTAHDTVWTPGLVVAGTAGAIAGGLIAAVGAPILVGGAVLGGLAGLIAGEILNSDSAAEAPVDAGPEGATGGMICVCRPVALGSGDGRR